MAFNSGDQLFWAQRRNLIRFTDTAENWPKTCQDLLDKHQITDIVLYGEARAHHAEAARIAKERGLRVHFFEEGYMRPYWVTYERGGTNGNSRLMEIPVSEMARQLGKCDLRPPPAPAHWGEMRQHVFYGALYHYFVLGLNWRFRKFLPHRGISVGAEFRHYIRRLFLMPAQAVHRAIMTRKALRGGFPYHLVLLQLEHDASFRAHSPFKSGAEFMEICVRGFAKGAPPHHRLVFKAHPLEDGRARQRVKLRKLAKKYGVADRVFYIRGGKLAYLLRTATSAITVNSTAAQQVLWRGLPLKSFGKAVYTKPEFVSPQGIEAFFRNPMVPDLDAYHTYRRFLMETSQITGGYYSRAGREALLRRATDLVLQDSDTYSRLARPDAAPQQHLAAVQ
nr:capsule biosynthesis protein CapA [Actibacterium pelagium]